MSRPVTKDHSQGDFKATWYEHGPIGLSCRTGRHQGAAEVVLDIWTIFQLERRLECPCGKYARIESY